MELRNNKDIIPKYIDIEMTNCCNIQCNMCPVGTGEMKRVHGFMTEEVLEKVCENIKHFHIEGVRLIRWGEPTLHPHFIDYIKRLKETGTLVHFNTNGTLLTEDMMRVLIDMEIDSVKFSFQGVDELSYSEMRTGGHYQRLIDTIKKLHALRGDKEKPYIAISSSTTYESDESINAFIQSLQVYCDNINVGKTKMKYVDINHMGLSEERRKVYEQYMKSDSFQMRRLAVCPEVWDKLSINWDGSVSACCSDHDNFMLCGNILEQNIQDIFHSDKAWEYRDIIKRGDYDQLEICSNCYEYIKLQK